MKADQQGDTPTAVWKVLQEALGEVIVGLADIQMRTVVTTKLAPAIYLVCCAGVVGLNAYAAVVAFGQSLAFGLTWLLLVMPFMLLAGLVTVRVVLEVVLSIFRILVNMETMMEQVQTLRGRTDEIVEDLPRIQFWRSRKRYSAPKRGEAAEDNATDDPDLRNGR